jgi:Caspase domain
MTRKALLIVCPGTAGTQQYLAGTLVDANNYEKFLWSKYGGDWYSSEIETLVNPTISEVKRAIQSIQADYSFVVYSGHGGVGNVDDRMYIELTDGDILINDLKTKSKWQSLIIDSCRTIFRQILNEVELKAFSDRSYGIAADARKKFEEHFQICEEGIVTIYACGKGQAAGDDKEVGGVFSASLIKVGRNWGQSTGYSSVLDLSGAFDEAVRLMNRDFITTQTPELNGGRRKYYFPFAVR